MSYFYFKRSQFLASARLKVLGLLILVPVLGFGQSNSSAASLGAEYLPKTPTVSALPQYSGQNNVNLITGAVQYTLPLTEITCGALRVPVSLNYSYSGLQVYQSTDLVGMGWSLQAGGSITRQINGLYDTPEAAFNSDTVGAHLADQTYLRDVAENRVDAEPDLYTFQMGGYSGRFTLQGGRAVVMSNEPVRVAYTDTSQFQLTTDDGEQYWFQAREMTYPNRHNFGHLPAHYVSTWHLTTVVSASRRDTLRFHYSNPSNAFFADPQHIAASSARQFTGTTSLVQACGIANSYTHTNTVQYGSAIRFQLLDSISGRTARVVFRWGTGRVLDAVQLVSLAGPRRIVRCFTLSHSWFDPGLNQTRRRLDQVQERNGALALPPHTFRYEEDATFPPVTSLGMDHLGYYNGVTTNLSLTPQPGFDVYTANRTPNFIKSRLGALAEIRYPTGGTTVFEYEPNTYQFPAQQTRSFREESGAVEYADSTAYLAQVNNPSSPNPILRSVSSNTFFFELGHTENIDFHLYRTLTQESSGPHSGNFNQYDDLQLYRVLPTGDSLITRQEVVVGAQDKVFTRTLRAGRYKVKVFCEQRETFVAAYVAIPFYTLTRQKNGPGIRVRQTTTISSPLAPPLTRRYRYTVQDTLGVYSSGHLRLPLNERGEVEYASRPFTILQKDMGPNCQAVGGFGIPGCPPVECTYANYTSTSEAFGQHLSKYKWFYQSVTEQSLRDSVPEGQTVYRFRECREAFHDVLPTDQLRYARRADGSFQMVDATRTVYTPLTTASFFTIRPYQVFQLGPNMGQQAGTVTSNYQVESSSFYAASVHLTKQTSTKYGLTSDSVSTTTLNNYRDKRLVRRCSLLSGVAQVTHYKYATEYDPALFWAAGLQQKGANPVVETQNWRLRLAAGQALADSMLVGGTITCFDAQLCAPLFGYRLRLPHPVTSLDREPTPTAQGRYNQLLSDSRYTLETTYKYEAQYGNPVQVARTQAGLGMVSYVWGQRGETVLAHAAQARPNQLAYTGFEPLSAGRWQFNEAGVVPGGRTGEYAYRLEANRLIQRDALPGGEYVVTCWAPQAPALYVNSTAASAFQAKGPILGSGGWQQWHLRVTVPSGGTISVRPPIGQSLVIDELVLHPVGAHMTTYTQLPLVGVTSQTDPSGRTVTYEYDALGRLVRTRDEQGRLLSEQQYHYAGQ